MPPVAARTQAGTNQRDPNAASLPGTIVSQEQLENRLLRLRALAHPARIRILAMVTGKAISATEVASATGLAHAAASYHLRQLAVAGLIEPTGGREAAPRRSGRPLQRYRMRAAGFRRLGRSSVQSLHRALLRELDRRLRVSAKQSHTVDAEVWLDSTDWREVRSLMRRASAIVHGRARSPGSRGAKHISFTSLLLELRK